MTRSPLPLKVAWLFLAGEEEERAEMEKLRDGHPQKIHFASSSVHRRSKLTTTMTTMRMCSNTL